MASADELLAQQHDTEQKASAQEALAVSARERALAAKTAERLQSLLENPDVQWFLQTYVDPIVAAEDKDTHDLQRSAAQADISRHRHALAVKIQTLLQTEHTLASAKAAAPIPGEQG